MGSEAHRARKTRKRLAQTRKSLPTVFRARQVAELLAISEAQARRVLAYWARSGGVRRVSYGWYSFAGEAKCADFAIAHAARRFDGGYLGGTAAAVRAGLLPSDKYRLGSSRTEAIDWIIPITVPRRYVRVAGHWFCITTPRRSVEADIVRRPIGGSWVPCASRMRTAADAFWLSDCWPGAGRRLKVFRRYFAISPPSSDLPAVELFGTIWDAAARSKSCETLRKNSLEDCAVQDGVPRIAQFLARLRSRLVGVGGSVI